MANEIISHQEMCHREKLSLQRGMNFRPMATFSIVLMSVRKNAPYRDRFENEGTTLIYEGHNTPKSSSDVDPKSIDQPEVNKTGRLTENGKFARAVELYKSGLQPARKVRVYEKVRDGIWAYNGCFDLVDCWREFDGRRFVFKFRMISTEELSGNLEQRILTARSRLIPSSVKQEVWKRDEGKCVMCGAVDELHFDHVVPYSLGGTSLKAENVQLLCARHNLEKHAAIA